MMDNLKKAGAAELWDLLKRNAIHDTNLANKTKASSNLATTFRWDNLHDRYTLFLNKGTGEIKDNLIEELPKKRINLTNTQKSNCINKVLICNSLKKVQYQDLLKELREESSNLMIYLFGLTNVKLKLDKDFKINYEIQVGSSNYSRLNRIFDNFILQSDFFKKENNYVLVKVSGPDDNETARKAENKANVFINILNGLFYNLSEPIGTMTQINKNIESSSFFYFKKNHDKWIESDNTRPGRVVPYITLNENELKNIKDLYDNKKKNNKYSKLIFALNWLGKSIKETDYGSAFLDVIIALECIAEKQSKGLVSPSINYQISNFVAMILGKSVEERKSLIKKMKKFYEKRSQIVHAGQDKIIYEDYKDLFLLMQKLIYKIIYESPYKEAQDLNMLVEQQLLS